MSTLRCLFLNIFYICDAVNGWRRMVSWWARSDSNRGPRDSLQSRRFRREWTISSPRRGAGRSSLLLSAL